MYNNMWHSKEVSDFQCGTVIECQLSNKSVHHISAMLELSRSNVSAVIYTVPVKSWDTPTYSRIYI